MATAQTPVSEALILAASQETQRGMLAEWSGNRAGAARHLTAAAHLELVIAEDYDDAGNSRDALYRMISAASCFWRGGDIPRARELFGGMQSKYPKKAKLIAEIVAELERDFPEESKNRKSRKKA